MARLDGIGMASVPVRVPRRLERLASTCLRAEAKDNRLGDLSERYAGNHARVRSHLGDAAWAMRLSHLTADFLYLVAAANVIVFARAIDPILRVAEDAAMPHVTTDLRERTMSALRVGAGKLVLPSLMLLGCALLVSSAVDAWSTWRQGEASMEREQREKANAAAHRIEQFVTALQAQLGWTTVPRMPATSLEQRRINDLILLRQTPAITQVVHLDRAGKEELKVSRLVMDRIGTGDDFSTDVRFKQALANGVYFGPVYLRSPSEPYMSLAMAHGSDRSGVTIADVNLKTLWEAIAAVTVGEAGYAYAVDGNGRLIAHRDASLVPSELDLSALPQVRAALRGQASTRSTEGKAFDARGSVLSAHALVPSVRWHVFVEVPAAEVQKPFWRSLVRVGCMLGLAVVAALTASHLAARRVTPSGVAPA